MGFRPRRSQGRYARQNKKAPSAGKRRSLFCVYPGGDLRSHTVARAVSSALRGLTSVFGMGTGVTLAVLPPETFCPPRRSGLLRTSRGERNNRFGWQLQVRLKIERTVHLIGSCSSPK